MREDFLISKINELEMKDFELEKRLKAIEQINLTSDEIESSIDLKKNTRIERYLFNGNVFKKSRLVLAVLNKYVENHPNVTAAELSLAFPASAFNISSFSCVKDVKLIPENHKSPVKRYFIDDLIELCDGTKVAVCTQWGSNINLFIKFVKRYGFDIQQVSL